MPFQEIAFALYDFAYNALSNVPGGLPTELTGGALGAFLGSRIEKLRSSLAAGQKDQNHELQQALADSYWLALAYLAQEHAAAHSQDSLPKGLAAVPWCTSAWNAMRGIAPASLPSADQAEQSQAAQAAIQSLFGFVGKSQTVDVDAIYGEFQNLLARNTPPSEAREELRAQAVNDLAELLHAFPHPEQLTARVKSEFDEYFRAAFAARLKATPSVETIFNAILISETREMVAVIASQLTVLRAETRGDHARLEALLIKLIELLSNRNDASPPIIPTQPAACYGREDELRRLAELLLPQGAATAPVLVCSVQGLPGVGKSLLVDTFAHRHWVAHFPGGYVSLRLGPDDAFDAATFVDRLAQTFGIPPGTTNLAAAVRRRLADPRTLLHIENVDSDAAAKASADLIAQLPGVPAVLSSRVQNLGLGKGWRPFPLDPVSEAAALEIFAEYQVPPSDDAKELARRLGYLPLALRLLAAVIAAGYETLATLLGKASLLEVESPDPAENDRHRQLRACFDISLRAFLSVQSNLNPLRDFGFLPLEGAGTSLATAWCGMDGESNFRQYFACARRFSLIAEDGGRWRAHPLLASYLKTLPVANAAESDSARFENCFAWFAARFPAGDGVRWNEVAEELPALSVFLDAVPTAEPHRVERAANMFAILRGPYRMWMRFCARALDELTEPREISDVLWTYANVAQRAGDLDLSLALATRKVEVDASRGPGAERDKALAWGMIAHIRMARGDLDEALRIMLEEELPVYDKLGDVRARAVTQGQIADIRMARGDLDEALRIYENELLPALKKLGDERLLAVTQGRIADIWMARSDLDEALRIRLEEELPVFEKLGDWRERAVTQGKIAQIHAARGDYRTAVQILESEVVPVRIKLGDEIGLVHNRAQLAVWLFDSDPVRATALFQQSLDAARRMRLSVALQIESLMKERGIPTE